MNNSHPLSPLLLFRQLLTESQPNIEALTLNTSLEPDDILSVSRVSTADYIALFRNIHRIWGSETWGLDIGSSVHHGAMGAHGYAVMAAPNLEEALRLVISYNALTSPMCNFVINEHDQHVDICLEISIEAPEIESGLLDMAMSLSYRMLCAPFPLAKDQISVFYKAPAPDYRQQLEQIFGEHLFQNQRCGFRIPKLLYKQDSPLHEPSVWKAAEQACYRQMSLLDFNDKRNLVPIVEERINSSIDNNYRSSMYRPLVTLEEVAEYMETNEFTLRRTLADQGYKYREIKEECQKDWLYKLLPDPKISLETMGLILGYSEQSNFTRACKRWTGLSPSKLRKQTD